MAAQVGRDDPAASPDSRPAVLIIGGMGYIGRFLALHLHKNNLASEVRLVDKVLPQLAWLAPEFKEACAPELFMQADASREQSLTRIFDRSNGQPWDYVFNCGGETRFSQEEEVYRLRSLGLAVALGKEAAKRGCKAMVEVGTGMVYKPESSPRKETDKLKPWSKMGKYKLLAEEELSKIEGLNLIIIRLPHVYGEYSSKFVATALALARVYQDLGEELKWLWTKELRVNTVEVNDVARALWRAAEWLSQGKPGWDETWGKVPVFNVVDHGDTCSYPLLFWWDSTCIANVLWLTTTAQGTIEQIIGQVFDIQTGFQGQLISSFARMNLDNVVDDVNDKILGPWADLLAEAKITRAGPISPFMEKELLRDTDLSLDGSRFEKVTGFEYEKPCLTKEEVEKMIESYRRMNWWP
ncbi:MAG: hypothetical protein M4579_004073 [Chaenotheca gracillima]|nr:MAG: hypothetical protein M4579_004073 [Chaenotheca gracillima]